MSRGLGKMQSGILAEIGNLGGEVLQNQLLWQLAERNSKIRRERPISGELYEGAIENSFRTSFMRAVTTLVEDEKVKAKDRPINDLSGLSTYYPFKTFRFEILSLRKILLPVIVGYLEGGYGRLSAVPHLYPRFGTDDHELFILKKIKESSPQFHKRIKARWLTFEEELLKIMVSKKRTGPDLWTRLFIRGRQLFLEEGRLEYGLAFHGILGKLSTMEEPMSESERAFLERIERFKAWVFQEDDVRRAAMKTALYQLANFQKGGAATLHKEIKGFLLKEHPDLIRNLPGHKDPPSTFRGSWLFEATTFSKLLDKLIDRHVFSAFRFIAVR